MRQIMILLLIISTSGCTSKKDKLCKYTFAMIEKSYGIDNDFLKSFDNINFKVNTKSEYRRIYHIEINVNDIDNKFLARYEVNKLDSVFFWYNGMKIKANDLNSISFINTDTLVKLQNTLALTKKVIGKPIKSIIHSQSRLSNKSLRYSLFSLDDPLCGYFYVFLDAKISLKQEKVLKDNGFNKNGDDIYFNKMLFRHSELYHILNLADDQ